MQDDWDYVEEVCGIFESQGGTVYFVELEAEVKERIKRNKSPHRLEHKPTKRNIQWSENDLVQSMVQYRLNSRSGELKRENYIKIDNSGLSAEEAAKMIKEKFEL